MIRVLLVDDHELLRRGVRLLLESAEGLEVAAEAAHGDEALAMIAKHGPDVVLADARMPVMDGVELVRRCGRQHPGLPVLILTTFDDDPLVLDVVRAGAAGFLLKDVSPESLAETITAVCAGGTVIDPRVAGVALRGSQDEGREPERPELAALTRAERAVAVRIAQGRTNAEIAADLVLAEGTVKNHVSALLRKLPVRDRTSLALLLRDVGV